MKLSVVVPTQEYRSYAGARIRYDRLVPPLQDLGVDLSLIDIDSFDPDQSHAEAVLISKCYDARAVLAAKGSRARGKLVGLDLFDDYFSQLSDSRLVRYRDWLRELTSVADFALCSTWQLAETVAAYAPALPIHVLNDPAPPVPSSEIRSRVADKIAAVRDEGKIRAAWFGVGGNRYFPVGLRDLPMCASVLRDLTVAGLGLDLSVVTDRRSLDAEGLASISSLPVDAHVYEWSEAAERDLLENCTIALLPVNSQAFSTAKSMNRAVTALSFGCQVLSVGYPLYASLGDFVYRDAQSFLADLTKGPLRMSEDAVERYLLELEKLGSHEREAARLSCFLQDLASPAPFSAEQPVLVHGLETRADAHRRVRVIGGLSVASPFCAAPLDFDVVFRAGPRGLMMFVRKDAVRRMTPQARWRLVRGRRIRGRAYALVPFPDQDARGLAHSAWEGFPTAVQLATYPSLMAEINERIIETFGPSEIIISEVSDLPPERRATA